MAAANRCPSCKVTIRPTAGTCEKCGADLDAHRRKRQAAAQRRPTIVTPQIDLDRDAVESTVSIFLTLVMVLFAPLFGIIIGALVAMYAEYNGHSWRRNLAILCCVLGLVVLIGNWQPVTQVAP